MKKEEEEKRKKKEDCFCSQKTGCSDVRASEGEKDASARLALSANRTWSCYAGQRLHGPGGAWMLEKLPEVSVPACQLLADSEMVIEEYYK